MGPPPAPTPAPAASRGLIDTDIPCATCDYNLRGLTAGGTCPECGSAIQESLRAETLAAANPRWRRRLRWGIALLALSPLPLMGGTFLRNLTTPWLLVTWVSLPVGFKLDTLQTMLPEYNHNAWALAAATTLLTAAGTWLLAAPWPWPASDPRLRRRVLRAMSAFAAAAAVIFVAMPVSYMLGLRWWAWWPFDTRIAWSTAFVLFDAAHAIVLLSYSGTLAARSRDRRLTVFLRRLTWAVGLQQTFAAAAWVHRYIGFLRGGVYWSTPRGLYYAVLTAVCATPLLAIAMWWALYRLHRQLRPRPRVTPVAG